MAVGEVPHNYSGIGYKKDKDGNDTAEETVVAGPEPAKNANSYVDPAKVAEAIQNLKDVTVGEDGNITAIKTKVETVAVDADGSMLSVEDATMEPIISDLAGQIGGIGASLEPGFEEIQDFAQKEHDKKQLEYNEEKKAEMSTKNGAHRARDDGAASGN